MRENTAMSVYLGYHELAFSFILDFVASAYNAPVRRVLSKVYEYPLRPKPLSKKDMIKVDPLLGNPSCQPEDRRLGAEPRLVASGGSSSDLGSRSTLLGNQN
jgi:hypothetical protein